MAIDARGWGPCTLEARSRTRETASSGALLDKIVRR